MSSEAECCIHCGYPLKQKSLINGIAYDFTDELSLVLNDRNIEAIKSVRVKTGLGLADGKAIVDYMITNKKVPSALSFRKTAQSSIPKCPTCGSTNIRPISGTERAVSVIGLGLFSKKINKTYKCLNCKHTW